jgi:hypothetical protein
MALATYFNSNLLATAVAARTNGAKLVYFEFQNPNNVDCWVQLFDLALANVTVGTTTPKQSFLVPANGGNDKVFPDSGFIDFVNGVSIAATTTATGSGAPSTGLVVNMGMR